MFISKNRNKIFHITAIGIFILFISVGCKSDRTLLSQKNQTYNHEKKVNAEKKIPEYGFEISGKFFDDKIFFVVKNTKPVLPDKTFSYSVNLIFEAGEKEHTIKYSGAFYSNLSFECKSQTDLKKEYNDYCQFKRFKGKVYLVIIVGHYVPVYFDKNTGVITYANKKSEIIYAKEVKLKNNYKFTTKLYPFLKLLKESGSEN